MPKVSRLPTSMRAGDYAMHTIAFNPVSIGSAIAKALSGLSAKAIAAKRTPRAEHVLAMLADDTLCALLLEEVNPALARQAKIIKAKKELQELESQ